MLPAGVVNNVDVDIETIFVNRTKEQIKNSPEFDPDRYREDTYRGEVGGYYNTGGSGWRDDEDLAPRN